MVTDALLLEHQAISIHNADQLRTAMQLHRKISYYDE